MSRVSVINTLWLTLKLTKFRNLCYSLEKGWLYYSLTYEKIKTFHMQILTFHIFHFWNHSIAFSLFHFIVSEKEKIFFNEGWSFCLHSNPTHYSVFCRALIYQICFLKLSVYYLSSLCSWTLNNTAWSAWVQLYRVFRKI